MMQYSSAELMGMDKRQRTQLINSITGFKSLSLIGSKSKAGITNLAPFSQIIHVGANPPLIGILFRPNVVPRHTMENILETGSFTLNHVTAEWIEKAHWTSARWEQSEFDRCGLTPHFEDGVYAPFVKESSIQMACEFREKLDIQINGTHFVIGEIVKLTVPKDCIQEDGFVDLEKAGTVTISGLDSYHLTRKVTRLSYAKPEQKPKPF